MVNETDKLKGKIADLEQCIKVLDERMYHAEARIAALMKSY